MEKANSYPWIPGGGMAIEVSVDGKVRREEGVVVLIVVGVRGGSGDGGGGGGE